MLAIINVNQLKPFMVNSVIEKIFGNDELLKISKVCNFFGIIVTTVADTLLNNKVNQGWTTKRSVLPQPNAVLIVDATVEKDLALETRQIEIVSRIKNLTVLSRLSEASKDLVIYEIYHLLSTFPKEVRNIFSGVSFTTCISLVPTLKKLRRNFIRNKLSIQRKMHVWLAISPQ